GVRRDASQRLARPGSLGARFIQREIVLSERSKPSMRSSPLIRGAPPALPRLGSQRPSERSISEPPSVSVFFRPASVLWRSAASRFENQSGANGRGFRREQDERMFTGRPNPPSDYPDKIIEEAQTRARMLTITRDEWLRQHIF